MANRNVWLCELEPKTPDGRTIYLADDILVLTTDKSKAKLFDSKMSANLIRLFYRRPRDPLLRSVKYADGWRIRTIFRRAWYSHVNVTLTLDPFLAMRSRTEEVARTIITLVRRGNAPVPKLIVREHSLTERQTK